MATALAWTRRALELPLAPRVAAGVAVVAAAAALGFALGLGALHLQLLLLAAVLADALALGTAAGIVGATAGFAALLWRGLTPEGGGWALPWPALVDAFLWFALAKLTAAVVAAPRSLVARLAAAREDAEVAAQRRALLVGEMSHRVMNDLQRLAGLLDAQARADPAAAAPLRAAAGRVKVLGRLHHRLTAPGSAAAVDSRRFLEAVAEDLRAATAGGPVAVTVAAASHPLPLAAASDLGLVVNELVTNALKHAFPGGRGGTVRVRFRLEEGGGAYALEVADDGVGLPSGGGGGGLGPGRHGGGGAGGGFGGRLVRALAAQLGGRVEVASGEVGGTVVHLRFPVPEAGTPPRDDAAGLAEAAAADAPAPERRGTGTEG